MTTFSVPPRFVPPLRAADHVPTVKLLQAIFGETRHRQGIHRFYDKCPWVGWDTPALMQAINGFLWTGESLDRPRLDQLWQRSRDVHRMPLYLLGLTARICGALFRANIHTIGNLMAMTDDQVLQVRNIGPTGTREIRERLAAWREERKVRVPLTAEESEELGHLQDLALGVRLTERDSRVLKLRFGLEDGRSRTLEEVGREFGVTKEVIRQTEGRALRRLRHPSRAPALRCYRYVYDAHDEQAALARGELYDLLAPIYGEPLGYEFTMRITRSHLAEALRAAHAESTQLLGRALAASCRVASVITPCLLCDEPALPFEDWCLEHRYIGKTVRIVVVCDGCGVRFTRRPGQLTGYTRHHGRTQHRVYCTKACFYAHAKEVMAFRRPRSRNKAKVAP